MTTPTGGWDETVPAGIRKINLGDNDIRRLKSQVREVIAVDHEFASDQSDDTAGQHKQVTLQEAADIGTGAEGVPILGAQTVDGKAELLFTDEDDNDIQITSGGVIDLGSARLDNDESLAGRNAADDDNVEIIKVNASDQAEITPVALAAGGLLLPEITLPVTAANQGALYTKNDGTQTELYFGEESAGDEVQITSGGALVDSRPDGQIIKGWARFDGTGATGAKTATESYNVSGIVKNSTGNYTVSWDTDFASTTYCVLVSCNPSTPPNVIQVGTVVAGSVVITIGALSEGAAADSSIICVMAMGAQ